MQQKTSFFWSVYPHIWTEYSKVITAARIFSYSVHMQEDIQRIKPVLWCILCSATPRKLIHICLLLERKHFALCIDIKLLKSRGRQKVFLNTKYFSKFGKKKNYVKFLVDCIFLKANKCALFWKLQKVARIPPLSTSMFFQA